MSRSGRLILGAVIAAGAVLGATQITSGSTNSTKESVFVGLVPTRLLDTRQGQTTFDGFDQAVGRLDANSTYELNIAGRAGITQGAVAAVINMVAVNPAAPGYLTVWPCSDSKPLASALNYETGENNANEFSIAIGDDGDICIYAFSATDVVVDVYGYYMASSGTGEQGPTGPQGATGPQGPIGTGITAKGSIKPDVGPPTDKDNPDIGDVWIDVNDHAWVWTEDDGWENVGKISGPAGTDGANGQDGAQGPEGPQGPVGTGIAAKGSLDYVGPPTDKDNPESGDVWIDTADDAWVWTDEGEWDNVGNIAGPPGKDGATGSKGDQGDTGPQGLPGADGADGESLSSANCAATLRWDLPACQAATVNVGGGPEGLVFDGTNVWVANKTDNTVSKIDPTTGTELLTVDVGTEPKGGVFDGTYIWIANRGTNDVAGSLSKIDPTTGNVTTAFTDPAGKGLHGMAFDGTNIWATNTTQGRVYKINPADGSVLLEITTITKPKAVLFDGTNIWISQEISNGGSVFKLDPDDGSELDKVTSIGNSFGLAFDGTHIWATKNQSTTAYVFKIDAIGNTGVTKTVTCDATNCGDLLRGIGFDGTYIWVASYNKHLVSKIDPADGTVIDTITYPDGTSPNALGFDGTNIWVSNNNANTVSKIVPL